MRQDDKINGPDLVPDSCPTASLTDCFLGSLLHAGLRYRAHINLNPVFYSISKDHQHGAEDGWEYMNQNNKQRKGKV